MIEVLRPGIQSTVQDLGRPGLRDRGIALAGALDTQALQYANLLAGNPPGHAALEIALGPVELRFTGATHIALAGMPMRATLTASGSRRQLQPGSLCTVGAGDVLALENQYVGGRCYLAVCGGIAVPPLMGSRATDLYGGFGGLQGRSIISGDTLVAGKAQQPLSQAQAGRSFIRARSPGHIVRALPGQDETLFDTATLERFWSSDWQLSPASNRMACRLQNTDWQTFCANERDSNDAHDMLSHAVMPGCVQLTPSGEAIVLLADAQTSGGYPKIAQVIEADLWRLAQMDQRSLFRLVRCTIPEAVHARQRQRADIFRFSLASRSLYD